MSLSCCLLDPAPFSKESGSYLGSGWADHRFGPTCISFLDGVEVFLVFASLLVHCLGFLFFGGLSVELIGSLYSGLWFPCSFYA